MAKFKRSLIGRYLCKFADNQLFHCHDGTLINCGFGCMNYGSKTRDPIGRAVITVICRKRAAPLAIALSEAMSDLLFAGVRLRACFGSFGFKWGVIW